MKKIFELVHGYDPERKKLIEFVRRCQHGSDKPLSILDVGCGYGRNLRALTEAGFKPLGVEINSTIVDANRKAGFRCSTAEEFEASTEMFELILMSHIVEHFSPSDLISFIDKHLDRLKPGGHLLIATPLENSLFYDDFDHVKPYHPAGITAVFGDHSAQVQYYARNKLKLVDLWFRKRPFFVVFHRALYVRAPLTRPLHLVNLLSAFLFLIARGCVGKTCGWVGLFVKRGND